MVRRLFDVVSAAVGLVLTAPVLALAIIGIRLSSRGPVLYRASRAGVDGRPFVMYKLRTMAVEHGAPKSRVTAVHDTRVFPFGDFLRHTKIDELPQLINVLRGDMSIVGPRPEDPYFVTQYYGPLHRETLTIRPGLAGPGSLYHDTHGSEYLGTGDSEARYLERLLPLKLALDLVYVRRASLAYDLAIIGRTLATIASTVVGRRSFPDPPEMAMARSLIAPLQQCPPEPRDATTPTIRSRPVAGLPDLGHAFHPMRAIEPRSETR